MNKTLEVDEGQASRAEVVDFRVGAVVVPVVLADIDRAVGVDGFDVHGVAEGTPVSDGDVTGTRRAVDRDAGRSGIAGPLVGITITTPVRHVTAG